MELIKQEVEKTFSKTVDELDCSHPQAADQVDYTESEKRTNSKTSSANRQYGENTRIPIT